LAFEEALRPKGLMAKNRR